MKMPISEIVDRYTITLLKSTKTKEDVSQELNDYQKEINNFIGRDQYKDNDIQFYTNKLKEANETIWNLETAAYRQSTDPMEEKDFYTIGKIALEVRKWNNIRNGIKNDLVKKYSQGFKEIAINYTKINYGKKNS